jgi:hypothetical protein
VSGINIENLPSRSVCIPVPAHAENTFAKMSGLFVSSTTRPFMVLVEVTCTLTGMACDEKMKASSNRRFFICVGFNSGEFR